MFHHGHLLDELVLGWDPEVDYLGLDVVVGGGRPRVDHEDTAWAVACATRRFVSAMWALNSKSRAEEWQVLRRLQDLHVCGYYPAGPSGFTLVGAESQGPGIGGQVPVVPDRLGSRVPLPPACLPGAVRVLRGRARPRGRQR